MKNYLLAALTVCFFVSCSSDPPDTTGTKLVKVLEIDSDDLTDSTAFDQYAYDDRGRVSFIYWDDISAILAQFYYNGSDTKPYRMDSEGNESTHYFSYTNDGKLLKDSSVNIYNQYYHVYRYSYPHPAQVIVTVENWEIASGSISDGTVDSLQLDGNGNIISYKQYLNYAPLGGLELLESGNYTYDNKPNPLFNLNIGFLNRYAYTIETLNDRNTFQANNCTSHELRYYSAGIPTPLIRYSFTNSYNSNNYIKESIGIEASDPTHFWKDIFIYE